MGNINKEIPLADENKGPEGEWKITVNVKAANLLDSAISRLKEELDINLSNLDYLKGLSQRHPIVTNPNSGISQFSPEYGIPELDKFEWRLRKDFQTAVGESLVWLEQIIIALEEKGLELVDERERLALYKTAYKWANYDYSSGVPEYSSMSKRWGIAKTIFGLYEIGLETKYDDRLMEWAYDKYESARKKAWIQWFPKTFRQIQGFLNNYHERPVELKWVQSIDPWNWHNLLLYGFHFKK